MEHRCRKKELNVLLMGEEEDEDVEGASSDSPLSTPEETATEVSVIGLSNPKNMKVMGLNGETEVVVMIDPGATHNF